MNPNRLKELRQALTELREMCRLEAGLERSVYVRRVWQEAGQWAENTAAKHNLTLELTWQERQALPSQPPLDPMRPTTKPGHAAGPPAGGATREGARNERERVGSSTFPARPNRQRPARDGSDRKAERTNRAGTLS